MNWKNVDLNSAYECSRNILEPLSFEELLAIMECNVVDINTEALEFTFNQILRAKVDEAKDIFRENQANILKKAIKTRLIP
jgi:hypothetical protein